MSKVSFSEQNLKTILNGGSVIDLDHLEVQSLDQAHQFIHSYGYDVHDEKDVEELWGIYRKSISLLREHLIEDGESIPEELGDPALLGEIGNLLLMASFKTHSKNQKWACAILKVMHAFAHVNNDLFSQFSDVIQDQVLKKFRDCIVEDAVTGVRLGTGEDAIYLHKFVVKPFKRTSSSVIKLLTKSHAVAISLLDRLGVRFVTKNVYDSFRVVDFLVKQNVISLPNVMPEQSHNNLYPLNFFLKVIQEKKVSSQENINDLLIKKMKENPDAAEFRIKDNQYSSQNYRFMKFISRQLVEINVGEKNIRFFFPFEIQIVDYETFINNLSGDQAHDEYKARQKNAARLRIFGHK